MEPEGHNPPTTTSSRLVEDEDEDEDDSESDDQGPMWNTPLNSKPVFKAEEIDFSENTAMTSPCSSATTHSSHESRSFTISFDDDHDIIEVDCDYTDEQVSELWFTKDEYDDFLQACDEDAQKCEAREKETRVNKLKKEIKKQRRQRQKEEKRMQRIRPSDHALDESMNSMAHFEMDEEEFSDDSENDEPEDPALEYNEDEEGWLCSLGLEAWTLEGYKAREHHRQKAIDSVLNEQYAAWDRGMVENMEMMSALYFAASAITKHEAHKKAVELEADVQEYTVVSTLEDYNRAVQTLNVLQKSLSCIQIQRKEREAKNDSRPLAKRRGSTGSTIPSHTVAARRGSTGNISISGAGGNSSATGVLDHSLAIPKRIDQAPQIPVKSTSPHPPQTSSSSSSRKKLKQRNGVQKVYKSKAATDILFSPPTPPVTKKPTVAYKPSQGGRPGGEAPQSKEAEELSTPKYRKIVYKPIVGDSPKYETGSRSRHSETGSKSRSSETATTKKKKKKKRDSSKSKKHSSERERHRYRSKSPRPRELSKERTRSKSPRPRELSKERTRSKSPCPGDPGSERTRSKSPRANRRTKESSGTGKLLKKTSPIIKQRNSVTKNVAPQRSSKKEHWWFQQQRQACQ